MDQRQEQEAFDQYLDGQREHACTTCEICGEDIYVPGYDRCPDCEGGPSMDEMERETEIPEDPQKGRLL